MKPLKAASSNSDAMSNFQNPLSEGQQVVPLPGAEQTTSLLVVLISHRCCAALYRKFSRELGGKMVNRAGNMINW